MSTGFPEILTEFAACVDACRQRNPHVAAFGELKATDGSSPDYLSLRAAKKFEEIRARAPDDPFALHHLAVIYHGTAYQLHQNRQHASTEAVPFWRQALQAWAALVHHDAFWQTLRTRWREAPGHDRLFERLLNADLDSARAQLPDYLLKIHVSIVEQCWEAEPEIAREHLKLIREAGFEPERTGRHLDGLYAGLVGDISQLLNDSRADDARNRLRAYLAIDPESARVRCDLLRVCVAECDPLSVRESTAQRKALLSAEEKHANHPAVLALAGSDLMAASQLCDYYYQWAMTCNGQGLVTDQHDAEIGYFEEASRWAAKAMTFERCGQKARQLFLTACGNGAMGGLQGEANLWERARKLIDAGLAVAPEAPWLNALLALYHFRKNDRDRFRQQLQKAEQINSVEQNSEAASLLSNLRDLRNGDGLDDLLKKGFDALGAQRVYEAIGHFEKLIQRQDRLPDDILVMVFAGAARAHTMAGDLGTARAMYQQARSHVGPGTDPQIRKLLDTVGGLFQ
jgi:hypothetical protein